MNYHLIMVDEHGDTFLIDSWELSMLLDFDEIEAWKATELEKAQEAFPKAHSFYWEESAPQHWITDDNDDYDGDDEDVFIELTHNYSPCDIYGYCPYNEQCELHCHRYRK